MRPNKAVLAYLLENKKKKCSMIVLILFFWMLSFLRIQFNLWYQCQIIHVRMYCTAATSAILECRVQKRGKTTLKESPSYSSLNFLWCTMKFLMCARAQPTLSQLLSFKICRTTFLKVHKIRRPSELWKGRSCVCTCVQMWSFLLLSILLQLLLLCSYLSLWVIC